MKVRRLTYIKIGPYFMTNIVKKIIPILFIASCAHIDYASLPKAASTLIRGAEDITITNEYFNQQDYSFLKLRRGRSGTSIFVLSTIASNGDYVWVSADLEKLITRNGKVIKLYSESPINFRVVDFKNHVLMNGSSGYFLELEKPHALLSQSVVIAHISEDSIPWLGQSVKADLFEESIETEKLNWAFTNLYWVVEGRVIRTEQRVHPNLSKLTIEYYYK